MELHEEWWEYHKANPQVYRLICKFAQRAIDRGIEKYAIATIWEVLRWHFTVETSAGADFKLPNNHRAYYSRLWTLDHPEHEGFFQTCRLRSMDPRIPRDRFGRDFDDDDPTLGV